MARNEQKSPNSRGVARCPGLTLGLTRMAERPIVIVTRKLPDVVETRLRELFDARLNLDDKPFSREELIEAIKTANVLVPTVTDRIDRGVLSQAGPNLKLIAQFGTGVDNIDLETARNRSIIVTNTPGVLTEDTADMTMALIIAVPRRLTEGAAILRAGNSEWHGWSPTWMLGHRIFGKRLGIVGMGRVGHGHHLDQLPAYAGDLSPALGAQARTDETINLYRQHRTRRGNRRECACPHDRE